MEAALKRQLILIVWCNSKKDEANCYKSALYSKILPEKLRVLG